MIVAGLDLSLSCTGLVVVQDSGEFMSYRIKPSQKLRGLERLRWIIYTLTQSGASSADMIVVEGPSYGSQGNQQGHHERAGLWWMAADALSRGKIEWVVVAPTALKKYVTGKGNASKDQVMWSIINRFSSLVNLEQGEPIDDNNVADALGLAAMGTDAIGSPLITVPKLNREALEKVQWPSSCVSSDPQLDAVAG